jgi:hypothetical protein
VRRIGLRSRRASRLRFVDERPVDTLCAANAPHGNASRPKSHRIEPDGRSVARLIDNMGAQ